MAKVRSRCALWLVVFLLGINSVVAAPSVAAQEPSQPESPGEFVEENAQPADVIAPTPVGGSEQPPYVPNSELDLPGLSAATAELTVDGVENGDGAPSFPLSLALDDRLVTGRDPGPVGVDEATDSTDQPEVSLPAEVLDQTLAGSVSSFDAAFSLGVETLDAALVADGALTVTLDYGDVSLAHGANVVDRLTVTRFDGCAVGEAPSGGELLECESWADVPSTNSPELREISFVVDASSVSAGQLAASEGQVPAADDGFGVGSVGGGSVFALTSMAASPEGDFTATQYGSLTEYQVGLHTGSAETSYAVPVPASPAGVAPEITWSYSSARVDGHNTSVNNQPGALGIGWAYHPGAITRSLSSCVPVSGSDVHQCRYHNDMDEDPIDDDYRIEFNGVSSRLVPDDSDGDVWHVEDDPMWRVERLVAPGSPTHPDENSLYWLVTAKDGTEYRFGGEFEETTDADLNSAFYTQIYSDDECSSGNLCQGVYQWNLDRVQDPNDNVMSLFYEQELNWYGSGEWEYVRAGHVSRIEYSKVAGSEGAQHAAQVVFVTEWRCGDQHTAFSDCEGDFPDTPSDLGCDPANEVCSEPSPTFWSERRLGTILTQVWNDDTDRWVSEGYYDPHQFFPTETANLRGIDGDPFTDEVDPKLWLQRIVNHPVGSEAADAFSFSAFEHIEAEAYSAQSGVVVDDGSIDVGGGKVVTSSDGDSLLFEDVDFTPGEGANELLVRASMSDNETAATIEFATTPTGAAFATIDVSASTEYDDFVLFSETSGLSGLTGVHDIYVRFDASTRLNWFRFHPEADQSEGGFFYFDQPQTVHFAHFDAYVLYNGAETLNSMAQYPALRIGRFVNELGGFVEFRYGQDFPCTDETLPLNGDSGGYANNEWQCYPALDPEAGTTDGYSVFNTWTVKSLTVGDTFASGNPDQVYEYDYEQPRFAKTWSPVTDLCDTTWNDFRGHEKVTVTDDTGAYDTFVFYQGMQGDLESCMGPERTGETIVFADGDGSETDHSWLRGRLAETKQYAANDDLLTRTRTEYGESTTSGDGALLLTAGVHADWIAARFVGVAHELSRTYGTGGAPGNQSDVFFSYDEYGNVTGEFRDGDTSTTTDDRFVERVFHHVDTASVYMVDRPQYEKLWDGDQPGTIGDEIRLTKFGWDDDDDDIVGVPSPGTEYIDLTPPTAGNLTVESVYKTRDPSDYRIYTMHDYDARGRRVRTTDGEGRFTETSYDALHGHVEEVENGLGEDTVFGYDLYQRMDNVTDSADNTSGAVYDGWGRVIEVHQPDYTTGPAVSYNYRDNNFPASLATTTIVGDGVEVPTFEYVDGSGRALQTQSVGPDGNDITAAASQYDTVGRLHRQSAPYDAGTGTPGAGMVSVTWSGVDSHHEYGYDGANRTIADNTMTGTTELWDTTTVYDGWTTTVTDPNGNATESVTDAWGNLARVTEPETGAITTYVYSAADELLHVTQDDQSPGTPVPADPWPTPNVTTTTSMRYHMTGWKEAINSPASRVTSFGYDNAGNLSEQTDARSRTVYLSYDAANRIEWRARQPNGTQRLGDYVYDAAGRLVSTEAADDQVLVEVDAYDAMNRPTAKTWTVTGAGTFSTEYVYDPAGNATEVTYPADDTGALGETVTTTYNTRGLPTTLTGDGTYGDDDYATAAVYDALTRMTSRTSGTGTNALTRTWGYDAATLRLDTITATVNTTDVVDLTYETWDDTGNLNRVVDVTNSGQVQCFVYDDLDRLTRGYTTGGACNGTANTGVGDAGYDEAYTYDDLGNLTSMAGTAFNFAFNPYKPRDFGDTDLSWNENGQLDVTDPPGPERTRYGFDYDNDLDGVLADVAGNTLFRYDADGARVVRQTPTDTTVYIDGGFEWNDTTSEATLHYQLGGDHIGMRNDGDLTWSVDDHLGSITASVEAGTTTTARQLYDPFGEIRTNAGAVTVPTDLGYTHQRLDETTGLMHYGARNYHPAMGRFISPDTIVPDPTNPQDHNRYTYTRNNPLKYTDPTGHGVDDPSDCRGNWSNGLCGPTVTDTAGWAGGSASSSGGGGTGGAWGPPTNSGGGFWENVIATSVGVAAGAACVAGSMATAGITAVTCGAISGMASSATYRHLTDTQPSSVAGILQVTAGDAIVGGATGYAGYRVFRLVPRLVPSSRARLSQDIAVSPAAPRTLPLNRPVGSSATQNQFVQSRIALLQEQGATAFRVNQQQVNVTGVRVGINRPDLQYTLNGRRFYEEFDTLVSTRGPGHAARIGANDPFGVINLFRVN